MLSNRLAFAALAIACVAAAATGGYVATRQSPAPPVSTDALATAAPAPGTDPSVRVPQAVQETEGLVGQSQAQAPAPVAPKPQPVPPAPRARAGASKPESQPRPEPQIAARAEEPVPSLDRTWPSTSAPSVPPAPAETALPPLAPQEEPAPEPPRAPEPPQPTFDELIVSADSVIGVQTETALSSERARVEDRVEARVVRDVRVGGRVAIPAGTRVLGSVTTVDRGGKMRERARLGIRFHTLAFADGSQTPITTDTIYRYGDAPGNKSAAKIGGGAVAGAILGAIIGGGKGAAIGATTGAAGGTAAVVAGDRSEATFPAGAEVTARILSPVTVTVER